MYCPIWARETASPSHRVVSSPFRRAASVAGLALAAIITVLAVSPASAQTDIVYLDGIVRFADRSLCSYTSTFFGREVYPLIEQIDAGGLVIGPGYANAANHLGLASIPVTSLAAPGSLRVTCEGLVFEQPITPADLSSGQVEIILPNRKPLAPKFTARLNGVPVRGAPAGATLAVEVIAGDPDGDVVHYQWGVSSGSITELDSPTNAWTLPNSRGLHFLYVLLSDGKGGYEERTLALSTDGGVVPAVGAFRVALPLLRGSGAAAVQPPAPAPAPILKPSDHVPANNHFLTYSALTRYDLAPAEGLGGPQDNRISACAYYRDLGAVGGCTVDGQPTGPQLTFAAWKAYWGFGAGGGTNEASALYANLADLNLQRDMHSVSRPVVRSDGTPSIDVASYVCNYPNPPGDVTLSNARLGNNLVACVSFEYTVTNSPVTGLPYNGGQPFTKFLTFGPTGDLLYSVNLDGRGEKFIPGACVACHGGSNYSGRYGELPSDTPALGAMFIPYDLDNYQFSTEPGYARADQEASLRALNMIVLDSGAYTRTVELIKGWYPTPDSLHIGAYVPPGWVGHEVLYDAVVKPQCRMCHVALDQEVLAFDTYAQFAGQSGIIRRRVCGSPGFERYWYSMPNAKETFDRFWNSIGGLPGVDQPATLLQFLIDEGAYFLDPLPECKLPSWLP